MNFRTLLHWWLIATASCCFTVTAAHAEEFDSSTYSSPPGVDPGNDPVVLHCKVERKSRRPAKQKPNAQEGSATATEEEGEISIEWDRWRNRFARAVWKRTNQKLAGGDAIMLGRFYIKYGNNRKPEIPRGAQVEVCCDITAERQVVNVHLVSTSGERNFNKLVLESFEDLNSKSLLEFPRGSQRNKVSMNLKLKIGTGEFQETKFDDVETVKFSKPGT